jgi:Domain of unknown function (DUF3597)
MGLFSKILQKLGLKKPEEEAPTTGTVSGPPKPTTAPAASTPKSAGTPKPAADATPKPAPRTVDPRTGQVPGMPQAPAKPVAVSEVDVVKKLEGLAASKPMKLNWKTSISDLLFLLDIENSYEARKELAVELGCPPELMGDSAKMNTWLHKEVLRQIAQNGGNIPKELLD